MTALPQSATAIDRRRMRVYLPAAVAFITLLIGFMEGSI